jgi:signal peptidase II
MNRCSYINGQAAQHVMHFSRKIRFFILLLVLGCAAGCDQASKHLARSELDHLGSVALPGGFGELRLVENPGSFLSLGDSFPEPLRLACFTVGTGVCLLGLFAYLVRTRLGRYNFIGLALIWVGGTSNLIDRVARHGLVTDFVVIRVGPLHTGIFNAADVMIMVGLAVLIYGHWKRRQGITF